MGYSDLDTSEQAQVDSLISASSEYIEKYCNRVFESTPYTEEHDGDLRDFIHAGFSGIH